MSLEGKENFFHPDDYEGDVMPEHVRASLEGTRAAIEDKAVEPDEIWAPPFLAEEYENDPFLPEKIREGFAAMREGLEIAKQVELESSLKALRSLNKMIKESKLQEKPVNVEGMSRLIFDILSDLRKNGFSEKQTTFPEVIERAYMERAKYALTQDIDPSRIDVFEWSESEQSKISKSANEIVGSRASIKSPKEQTIERLENLAGKKLDVEEEINPDPHKKEFLTPDEKADQKIKEWKRGRTDDEILERLEKQFKNESR